MIRIHESMLVVQLNTEWACHVPSCTIMYRDVAIRPTAVLGS